MNFENEQEANEYDRQQAMDEEADHQANLSAQGEAEAQMANEQQSMTNPTFAYELWKDFEENVTHLKKLKFRNFVSKESLLLIDLHNRIKKLESKLGSAMGKTR